MNKITNEFATKWFKMLGKSARKRLLSITFETGGKKYKKKIIKDLSNLKVYLT